MAFRESFSVDGFDFICTHEGVIVNMRLFDARWKADGDDRAMQDAIRSATACFWDFSPLIESMMRRGIEHINSVEEAMPIVREFFFEKHGSFQEFDDYRGDTKYPPSLEFIIQAFLQLDQEVEDARRARTPRGGPRAGFVYLLRSSSGFFKIGRTNSPDARLHRFEVALPFEVGFEHVIPTKDYCGSEAVMHTLYAHRRVNGEWFALTPEEIAEIKAITEM